MPIFCHLRLLHPLSLWTHLHIPFYSNKHKLLVLTSYICTFPSAYIQEREKKGGLSAKHSVSGTCLDDEPWLSNTSQERVLLVLKQYTGIPIQAPHDDYQNPLPLTGIRKPKTRFNLLGCFRCFPVRQLKTMGRLLPPDRLTTCL